MGIFTYITLFTNFCRPTITNGAVAGTVFAVAADAFTYGAALCNEKVQKYEKITGVLMFTGMFDAFIMLPIILTVLLFKGISEFVYNEYIDPGAKDRFEYKDTLKMYPGEYVQYMRKLREHEGWKENDEY